MTISIECVHCHKRYNAPGAMAGKKVKCKHCGQIFAIPANAPQAGDFDLSSVGEKLSEPAPSKSRTPAGGGKLGNASAGFSTKVARSEGAQTLDFADSSGGGVMLRPSIPMDFAGADALDRLAPLILILMGYGWLALSAFNSNKTGFGWVGLVRFIAFM